MQRDQVGLVKLSLAVIKLACVRVVVRKDRHKRSKAYF